MSTIEDYLNQVHHLDALTLCSRLPDQSIDTIITDPIYPEIDRDYGRITESEWFALMMALLPQFKRVLKPQGSAVIIIQPNMAKMGAMRLWAFEFMVWAAREWNLVQDVYWWNYAQPPLTTAHRDVGLLRGSVKLCVWLGNPDCYRNQENVLWQVADSTKMKAIVARNERKHHPSGISTNKARITRMPIERGGSSPYNLLPFANSDSQSSAGAFGHPAGTPLKLAEWWTRYLCPPDGIVLDPFGGSGTMGLAALRHHCHYVLGEKEGRYVDIARRRLHPSFGAPPHPEPDDDGMDDLPMFSAPPYPE